MSAVPRVRQWIDGRSKTECLMPEMLNWCGTKFEPMSRTTKKIKHNAMYKRWFDFHLYGRWSHDDCCSDPRGSLDGGHVSVPHLPLFYILLSAGRFRMLFPIAWNIHNIYFSTLCANDLFFATKLKGDPLVAAFVDSALITSHSIGYTATKGLELDALFES